MTYKVKTSRVNRPNGRIKALHIVASNGITLTAYFPWDANQVRDTRKIIDGFREIIADLKSKGIEIEENYFYDNK